MKKIYYLITILIFLFSGCSSTDYSKIRDEEREKLLLKESESREIISKTGESISLEEALSLGEKRNSSIKIVKIKSEIAKIDKNIAFGNFLPKITAIGAYNQFNEGVYGQTAGVELPFGIELETRLVDKNFYTAGLSATLPIFTPTAWYLYSARKKGMDISKEIEDFQIKKVRVEIINSYYHIAALQSEESYLKESMKHAGELMKNAKIGLETESIMPWQYEQSEQFLKSREFAMNKNSRDLTQAKMKFLKLLDLYPLVDFKIENSEKFSDKNVELNDAIYSALENNSLLKIEDIAHGVKKDIVKIAIAEFLPKIALTGGYSRNNNTAVVDPLIMNGSLMGAVNLFNGFQNINNYKKSKKNLEIADIEREESAAKVILETVNAFNFYQEVRENLELAEKNYSIVTQKHHEKKIQKELDMITDEEFLLILAEKEKAFAIMKSCQYRYEISLALMELVVGGYKDVK
ncbi:MAG: TolC family protein [Fusobacteriaceae bacterium]